MKIGFFLFLSSVYDYVNLYASFDIKDNTDMIKFKKSKTDSPRSGTRNKYRLRWIGTLSYIL